MAQVKVNEGILQGEIVRSDICGSFFSFKGIPYAAPPVGDLRFKAPQPPIPWEGVREAKEHGNQCYQFNFTTRVRENGSEDCLYLNVYTPNIKPAQPLPVMVWIHGGGFCFGNGNDSLYGPEFLIRHGVILVTLNYRLEVLGFLSLDTEDIPGNAGAKDQVAALRWVKSNIAQFGGDPQNVTIFGQSAGAITISAHCVSPMTKGLFKRAICQTGSHITWWPHTYKARERTLAFAKKLGCSSDDDKDIFEFFKKQPLSNLIEVIVPITEMEKTIDRYEPYNCIVSEKVFPNVETFFTGDIHEALRNNIHEGLELITGYNEDDGAIVLNSLFDENESILWANTSKLCFVPKCFEWLTLPDDQVEIGKAVRDYYSSGKEIISSNLTVLSDFYNGYYFKFGAIQLAKYFSRNNKVYFYKFTCKSERNFFSQILGISSFYEGKTICCHCDEMAYLFPMKIIKQEINFASDTYKMINNMTKLWTNFAKTGNPTSDISLGVNWRPYSIKTPYYVEIGSKLTRRISPDKDEVLFWENLMKKYLPQNVYQIEENKTNA